MIEELPIEHIPFTIDKPYDLQMLYKEVIDEMFNGKYEGIRNISWIDRPYKSYYGKYYNWDIMINVLINSSKVPKEVIKYVVYHELLHRNYEKHDIIFRLEEHKYSNYTELERYLDFKIGEYRLDW